MRHETIDAQKRDARYETIDEPRVSRLIPPRVSGLTSHAQWPKVKLGDAPITIIDGDRGKNYPKQNELFASGYCLFLSAENVTRQGFRFDSNKITIQKDSLLRNGKLARFDIILTTRGTLGNVALYGSSVPFENVRINSGMLILRCDTQKLLPNFLLYVLRSDDFISQVNGFKSGVAQPQLPIKDLKQIQIPLPPLPVQRQIADILSAYDDLIENNCRRIAILEEMARLTYRKWFGGAIKSDGGMRRETIDDQGLGVRHETIDDPHVSSLASKAPCVMRLTSHAQSRTATLGEIVDVLYGKDHKKIPCGAIPIFGSGGVMRYGTTAIFDKPSVLIPRKGSIGNVMYVDEPFWTVDTMFYTRFKLPNMEKILYYQLCDYNLASMSTGAAVPSMTTAILNSLEIEVPSDDLREKFDLTVEPMFEQKRLLKKQNAALAAARDMLLPRLMNNKLRKDA